VIQYQSLQKLLVFCFFNLIFLSASAQKVQDNYFYNAKGLTFLPAMKRPAIIYQGRLFVGRKQLTGLFNYLNNRELNLYFKKYRSNQTASTILKIAGVGLSVYSLLDWRSSDRKLNWYTLGGGLVISGVSGYLDLKASQNLRNAALVFDNATKKTTFVPRQPTLTFTISLGNHGK
jgi:hypothetical protein